MSDIRCVISARCRPALSLLVLAVVACGDDVRQGPPPPLVTVGEPMRRDVQNYFQFTGTTRAIEFAEIRARVQGSLEQMQFDPTTFVDSGDVLFVIEPAPYQATYNEAQASVASAQSELARAESDLERVSLAIQSNAVSRQDLDRAQATRDQAEAAVLGARARLEKAAINLRYTKVTTPITGQVSRNLVDLGNLVGATEPTLLTTVTRIDPIYVYFSAPERVVLQILAAQNDPANAVPDTSIGRVLIATAIDEGFPHGGRVDFVNNTVDPATGTIEIRAVIDNSDNTLFPGLFVRIRLLGGTTENAILVQERAIGTDLGGKFVLVVEEAENVVNQKYVKLGPLQDDGAVVVTEGLDGTERYIVNGMLRARPGFPVTPQIEAEVSGGI
ncbi:MAG: efflux RND transporter periplasmic adaptor subunit [Gemmatimonadetes bacterium]|nr:efflux RND transporter periplasmic adaptor subunit [Gemmatimonadota bacterium]MCZ6918526.1 efflux RND transporter periplasmic adaptor subunit [Gemmatimonadota bacterium]